MATVLSRNEARTLETLGGLLFIGSTNRTKNTKAAALTLLELINLDAKDREVVKRVIKISNSNYELDNLINRMLLSVGSELVWGSANGQIEESLKLAGVSVHEYPGEVFGFWDSSAYAKPYPKI